MQFNSAEKQAAKDAFNKVPEQQRNQMRLSSVRLTNGGFTGSGVLVKSSDSYDIIGIITAKHNLCVKAGIKRPETWDQDQVNKLMADFLNGLSVGYDPQGIDQDPQKTQALTSTNSDIEFRAGNESWDYDLMFISFKGDLEIKQWAKSNRSHRIDYSVYKNIPEFYKQQNQQNQQNQQIQQSKHNQPIQQIQQNQQQIQQKSKQKSKQQIQQKSKQKSKQQIQQIQQIQHDRQDRQDRPSKQILLNKQVFVTGFGNILDSNGQFPPKKQESHPFQVRTATITRLPETVLDKGDLCLNNVLTVTASNNTSTAPGDSGGPMFYIVNNTVYLLGATLGSNYEADRIIPDDPIKCNNSTFLYYQEKLF
ncbi:MAG: hypothetical protein F6J93_35420 [Oscillatoria sp. SIO1A7]|nr:hypothetical protein [Oscillatoria sp. SIO1A7]